MSNKKQTLVEEGTKFKGSLVSKCPVVVMGAVDGDLEAPSVTISGDGEVVGSIKAQSVHSEGALSGKVDADDVYLSGSVRSDSVIRAKTLEVKLSQDEASRKLEVSFGECVIEAGDEPTLEDEAGDSEDAHPGANGKDPDADGPSTGDGKPAADARA